MGGAGTGLGTGWAGTEAVEREWMPGLRRAERGGRCVVCGCVGLGGVGLNQVGLFGFGCGFVDMESLKWATIE